MLREQGTPNYNQIMSNSKQVKFGIAVAALVIGTGFTTAQASVISGTPNVDFDNGNYTLSLFDGQASYTFSDNGATGFSDPVDVSTSGNALIAALPSNLFDPNSALQPTSYFTDEGRRPTIGPDLLAQFASFDTPTTISNSATPSYLGLAFDFDGGTRYGYALLNGTALESYGYETEFGQSIQAGAQGVNDVPEPSSWGLMLAALGLLGCGVAARKGKFARRTGIA